MTNSALLIVAFASYFFSATGKPTEVTVHRLLLQFKDNDPSSKTIDVPVAVGKITLEKHGNESVAEIFDKLETLENLVLENEEMGDRIYLTEKYVEEKDKEKHSFTRTSKSVPWSHFTLHSWKLFVTIFVKVRSLEVDGEKIILENTPIYLRADVTYNIVIYNGIRQVTPKLNENKPITIDQVRMDNADGKPINSLGPYKSKECLHLWVKTKSTVTETYTGYAPNPGSQNNNRNTNAKPSNGFLGSQTVAKAINLFKRR